MEFDYYYGSQADQFSFIRIPRMLLTEDTFSSLTLQSKMLYSVLLDRMSLSMKNGWFDEENRVYIIYQISEIQADLGFSKRKAMDYLSELEEFGLVKKKKRGFGLPTGTAPLERIRSHSSTVLFRKLSLEVIGPLLIS